MCSLILLCAVLAAHLSGGANSAPQASWLDFGERRGEERGRRQSEWEMKGKRCWKGMGAILCSCDFFLRKYPAVWSRVCERENVRPPIHPLHQCAASLLLWAGQVGYTDGLLHGRRHSAHWYAPALEGHFGIA